MFPLIKKKKVFTNPSTNDGEKKKCLKKQLHTDLEEDKT